MHGMSGEESKNRVHKAPRRTEHVGEQEADYDPRSDDGDEDKSSPQRRGRKAVRQYGGYKEPEGHLSRDRDNDVQCRVVKGCTDGGVVQEAAVIRPADKRTLASWEHLPVEEADVELT